MQTEHSQVLSLNLQEITQRLEQQPNEFIINGLYKGGVGFLIAPPGAGKSYFALSLCYELALQQPIIGLSNNQRAIKTLFWPAEDGVIGTLPRLREHLTRFPEELQKQLEHHVGIYDSTLPICSSRNSSKAMTQAEDALNDLIEKATAYDLVIIDTIREAIGDANEVDDDYQVRVSLAKLAKKADVAVLAIHHPTKDVSRGNSPVNSVSGAGLSSTLSKSKLHLYLNQNIDKKSGDVVTQIRHIKANYVPIEQQFTTPVDLQWTRDSILHKNAEFINNLPFAQHDKDKATSPTSSRRKSKLPEAPVVIARDETKISEDANRRAEQQSQSTGPFGESMLSEVISAREKK